MQFTIFHTIAFVILLLCFVLGCVLIFIMAKKKEIALILYTMNALFSAILIYSILQSITEFTIQASLSKLTYTRDLRNESLNITGRVQNLTQFDIKKCYLYLNIADKKNVGQEIFESESLKNAVRKNTSFSYTIEIIDKLPGDTYKEFSAQVPFPPSFEDAEFYHTLKCF
ncbi:DUF2393 family protein [Campylobacter sp.]|uniref:DUF2393 family protein n=1 Tax=Campylobacter sp. TaxID=205 RepID=UPI0026DBDB05|nr:DUF2393 family protein [Campylobacter sp.]MDO4674633.1 DUF2393 family protein [Campylobacter sp.]